MDCLGNVYDIAMVTPLTLVAEWGHAAFTRTRMLLNVCAYSTSLPANVIEIVLAYVMPTHGEGPLCYEDSGVLMIIFMQTIGRVEQRHTVQWLW